MQLQFPAEASEDMKLPPLPLSGESDEGHDTNESLETVTATTDPVTTQPSARRKLMDALGARAKKPGPNTEVVTVETVTRRITYPSRDYRETVKEREQAEAKRARDRQNRDATIIEYRQLAGVKPGEPLPSDSFPHVHCPLPQISSLALPDNNQDHYVVHATKDATEGDNHPGTTSPADTKNVQLEELTAGASGTSTPKDTVDNVKKQLEKINIKQEDKPPGKPSNTVTLRDEADVEFITRAITAILLWGPAADLQITTLRAKQILEYTIGLPGWRPHAPCRDHLVDLTNPETRAISIVQIINFLPPMIGLTIYGPWLLDAPNKINRAITGVINPTAMMMTNDELTRFVNYYGKELYREAEKSGQLENISYLTNTVKKLLTGWIPLRLDKNGDKSKVRLRDLMFVGGKHHPGGLSQLLHDLTPAPKEFHGDTEVKPVAVPAMTKINRSNINNWKYQIDTRVVQAFSTPGTVLNNMNIGFLAAFFYNLDGTPETGEKPDIEVIPVGGYYDAIAELKQVYGENWEAGIRRHIGKPPPIPANRIDLKRNSTRVYPTTWKNTSYLIMEWDEASRICDMDVTSECRITARTLCMLPDHLRIRQLHDLRINFNGNFTISKRTEIPWPGWDNETRRRGLFLRTSGFKPGTRLVNDPENQPSFFRTPTLNHNRHTWPIMVYPESGNAGNLDILYAAGDTSPACFNQYRVPAEKLVFNMGQHASNPYELQGYQYLPASDRFIAGGPLTTIPINRSNPGTQLSLKRCTMCQVKLTVNHKPK